MLSRGSCPCVCVCARALALFQVLVRQQSRSARACTRTFSRLYGSIAQTSCSVPEVPFVFLFCMLGAVTFSCYLFLYIFFFIVCARIRALNAFIQPTSCNILGICGLLGQSVYTNRARASCQDKQVKRKLMHCYKRKCSNRL